jgi:hypothetical protein
MKTLILSQAFSNNGINDFFNSLMKHGGGPKNLDNVLSSKSA